MKNQDYFQLEFLQYFLCHPDLFMLSCKSSLSLSLVSCTSIRCLRNVLSLKATRNDFLKRSVKVSSGSSPYSAIVSPRNYVPTNSLRKKLPRAIDGRSMSMIESVALCEQLGKKFATVVFAVATESPSHPLLARGLSPRRTFRFARAFATLYQS